jgi:hypothetical protein
MNNESILDVEKEKEVEEVKEEGKEENSNSEDKKIITINGENQESTEKNLDNTRKISL